MRSRSIQLLLALAAALHAPAPLQAGRAGEVRVEAFRLLNQGVSAYSRGRYEEAVEFLGRCTAISLNSFKAHYYYGLALNAVRRHAESVSALRIALEFEPQDLQALVALGDAYLKLGDVDEGRAAYARALRLRAAHPAALDGMGRSYVATTDDQQAIDHFRRAIRSDPGFAPAYTHLGDTLLRLDRPREAVRLLEEAIAIRPDFSEGLGRLALAYGRVGMHEQGVAAIHRAIELDPDDPTFHESYGQLQLDQNLIERAEASFRRALELDAGMTQAHVGLAQIARRRGQYGVAVEQLLRALNHPLLLPPERERLESLQREIEQEELRSVRLEALAQAGQATAAESDQLARIFAARRLWRQAADTQRLALTSDEARERHAYYLFRAGRLREAHGLYRDLAERHPERRHLRLNAGVILVELGEDEAAGRQFAQLLSDDPEDATARLYLANSELRLGRTQQAAEHYSRYMNAGSERVEVERVQRILAQIAPELLPTEPSEIVPPAPPRPVKSGE